MCKTAPLPVSKMSVKVLKTIQFSSCIALLLCSSARKSLESKRVFLADSNPEDVNGNFPLESENKKNNLFF